LQSEEVILGIDPGSLRTGFGLITLKGCFKSTDAKNPRERESGLDTDQTREGKDSEVGHLKQPEVTISHLSHGTIVLNKTKDSLERLQDLAVDLSLLIKKYRPTRAVIEDVFLYKNARSALILGQARGVALAVFGLHKIPISSLATTKVKLLIAGQGQAQKFQVANWVALRLNIAPILSADASDALALALAEAHLMHDLIIKNC